MGGDAEGWKKGGREGETNNVDWRLLKREKGGSEEETKRGRGRGRDRRRREVETKRGREAEGLEGVRAERKGGRMRLRSDVQQTLRGGAGGRRKGRGISL